MNLFLLTSLLCAAGVAQDAAGTEPAAGSVDRVYASEALREFVARAAERNGRVPDGLWSYRAEVESEVGLVLLLSTGEELLGQAEQVASRVAWTRDGSYAQHVIGYRSLSLGVNISALSYMRRGWTFPILYGEQLFLSGSPDAEGRKDGERRGPRYETIHPLSAGRDSVYRFEGGDTVAVLALPERTVRVVRVRVEPRRAPARRVLLYHGDIDLDADRHEIVRMRGRLVWVAPGRPLVSRLLGAGVNSFAFVELENGEFEGRYWLPYRQRIEFQATTPLTDSRAVMRVVSRFRHHAVNVPEAGGEGVAVAFASPGTAVAGSPSRDAGATGSPRRPSFRLTFAPGDSMGGYGAWTGEPGQATAEVSARDFDDVAPRALRADGPPHARLGARRATDLLRYNRVEGLYTGIGGILEFRDVVPGLELSGTVGWAWREEALKGGLEALLRRGAWEYSLRGARELAHTNDFLPPLAQGSGFLMLLGAGDSYDYVDRRSVTAAAARRLGVVGDSRAVLEVGWAEDRAEPRRLLHGPYGGDTLRLNRPVGVGSYVLTRLTLEHGRSVNMNSVRPGLGVRLVLERATGELAWRRAEAGVQLQRRFDGLTLAGRLDAGIVDGDDPPPQRLYELGWNTGLSGYGYKEFAGDRAVTARLSARYDPGLFSAPIRIGNLILPSLSPSPSVMWYAGWTDASAAAAPVVERLGSRVTDGLPNAVAFQVEFFGGMLGAGVARPLDRSGRWRPVLSMAGEVQVGGWKER